MSKQQREVTIITRYFFKQGSQAGRVCCRVRNDQGIVHTVVIEPDGRTSCSCMSHRVCYHVLAVQAAECARVSQQPVQTTPQPADCSPVSLTHSPKSCTHGVTSHVQHVESRQQEFIKGAPAALTLARGAMPVDTMTLATIRKNRGFYIWK